MILVYGGAFDPPHAGHVSAVASACEFLKPSKVVILVAHTPPVDAHTQKSTHASFEQRLAMCEIAFAGLHADLEVSKIESELPKPNFSVKSLQSLQQKFPQERLVWLMGQDQIKNFPKWFDPKGILDLADLALVAREHKNSDQSLHQEIESMALQLGLNIVMIENQIWLEDSIPHKKSVVHVVEMKIILASSTEIRDSLHRHIAVPVSWIQPKVMQYIEQQNLYL